MNKLLPTICLGVALVGAFLNTAAAQPPLYAPDISNLPPIGGLDGVANTDGSDGRGQFATAFNLPWPGRVWFSYTGVDNGLGYGTGGYFTLGGKMRLGEDYFGGRWLAEARGHLSHEQGQVFGNFGIERIITIDPADADVGVSVWFDADGDRERNFGFSYQQIGIGGYIRKEFWELAANGYIPLGTTGNVLGSDGVNGCFFEHSIITQRGIDSALQGVDVELRLRPIQTEFWHATFDFGPYYYQDSDEGLTGVESFFGFRVRGGIRTLKGLSAEVEYNHDDRFNDTLFARLSISTQVFGDYDPRGQDLNPTKRNDHVVVYHQDPAFLIDPDTGLPYVLLHVDNTAAPGGNGTFERPFDEVADVDPLQAPLTGLAVGASAPDDVILVRVGDGTTTNYDTGITLQDRQFLIGEGFPVLLPTVNNNFFALCTPNDGVKPTITAPNGEDIVTLANNNLIASVTLDGGDPAANGIAGVDVTGLTVQNTMFLNLQEDGIHIERFDGDLLIEDSVFTNITDDAIEIIDVASLGNTLEFSRNMIGAADPDGIGDDGIVIDGFIADNTWIFDSNIITNTGAANLVPPLAGDGIALLDGFDFIPGLGAEFFFIDNTITDAGRFGINITHLSSDPADEYTFSGNMINNSGAAAVRFENTRGTFDFGTTNTFVGNVGGFQFDATNGEEFDLTLTEITGSGADTGLIVSASGGSTMNVVIEDSIFENNNDDGILFIAENARININSFQRNILRNNGGQGVELRGLDNGLFASDDPLTPEDVNPAIFQDNVFENNAEGGLAAFITDDPATPNPAGINLNLQVGADPANQKGNLFDGNGGFGIAVVLAGDANGRFDIQDNTIIRTVDDPNSAIFNGEGIHIRLAGADFLANSTSAINTNAALGGSIIANNIIGDLGDPTLGNASHGIQFFAEDETSISGLLGPPVIPSIDIFLNVIANNGDDGINITGDDSAIISDIRITRNLIDSNTNDGIHISSLQSAMVDFQDPFGVINNTITRNGAAGVNLTTASASTLLVDITDNAIGSLSNPALGNLGDGILYTSTGLGNMSGIWTGNTIANNGDNGIELAGLFGAFPLPVLLVDDNRIEANAGFGVEITGPGNATFNDNLILRNQGGGVNIAGTGPKGLLFTENLIRENVGHGVTIVNNSNAGLLAFDVTLLGNTIEANTRRGINIFNQGTADSFITIGGLGADDDNKIASNGEEAIFIVNTASILQDPDALATAALNADGAVTAEPRLFIEIDNNRIINNGSLSAFDATGIVLRVGTSGGGYAFDEAGGFFAGGLNSGVEATITNNTITGNTNGDVYIDSFVSTVDPATTGGDWTDQNEAARNFANDVFNPTGYQGDPLARLDLLWSGNVFGANLVNNVGASYNNAEAVFKSRTQGQDNATDAPFAGGDDNGPFNSGTRARNAQRLAARDVAPPAGGQLDPGLTIINGGNNSDDFLFAGLGQSTFRLLPGFDGTGGFIVDASYISINSANGVPVVPFAARPDQMPFGWNLNGGPNGGP